MWRRSAAPLLFRPSSAVSRKRAPLQWPPSALLTASRSSTAPTCRSHASTESAGSARKKQKEEKRRKKQQQAEKEPVELVPGPGEILEIELVYEGQPSFTPPFSLAAERSRAPHPSPPASAPSFFPSSSSSSSSTATVPARSPPPMAPLRPVQRPAWPYVATAPAARPSPFPRTSAPLPSSPSFTPSPSSSPGGGGAAAAAAASASAKKEPSVGARTFWLYMLCLALSLLAEQSSDKTKGGPKKEEEASGGNGGAQKTNSLELWAGTRRYQKLKKKLERGLDARERFTLLQLCSKAKMDTAAADRIIDGYRTADQKAQRKRLLGDRSEVTLGTVLMIVLGNQPRTVNYSVIKTKLNRETIESKEWVQDSQLLLQNASDPSRSVTLHIQVKIIEDKNNPSPKKEGLILVENELLEFFKRFVSSGDIPTYITKVNFAFTSSSIEVAFEDIRIS